MKNKFILSLLGAVSITASAFAQQGYTRIHNKMLEDAKSLYAGSQWLEAQKVYKKLLSVDTAFADVYYEIGVCETHLPGQRERAVTHFEQAARHGSLEAQYQLALTRHKEERFDEEIGLLTAYKQGTVREIDNTEIDRRISIANTAKELKSFPTEMKIKNMGALINSEAHDYCPLVTADGNTMYFTSRREGSVGGMRDPSGQYFEDIYVAKKIDDIWSNATNAGVPLNTYVQDATVGLSADGNEMIIYRTAQNLVSGDLFSCKRMQGLWQMPEKMTDRINSAYHEPSATISPDGSEIYFTSDRPGGFGGRDLYRIRRLPNGEWSLPLNLGPTINTANDEDAPFMHSDGTTLFFSSNGHNTMGGYDIFKAQLIDPDMNGWSVPENMGAPLNTVNDDIYFCMSEDGQTGYFSSERPGGLGGQDIYEVTFPSSQIDYIAVRGVIVNASEEPVKARITLNDAKGEGIAGVFNSNPRTGRYLMLLQPAQKYTYTVEAEGYETKTAELRTDGPADGSHEIALDITLIRNENTARVAKP